MLKATRWELNDRSFLSRMGNVFRPSTALTQRGHRPVLLKKHAFQGTFVLFFAPGHIPCSRNDEACEAKTWGRGYLYITGGIIQNTCGAVGTGAGTDYVKRYSFDACAATEPPPYFSDHRPLYQKPALSSRSGRV